MYHRINATETFRERHLVLLQEAEHRRLARRLRAARRSGQEKVMRPLRNTALLFVAVTAIVVLASTAALAEIKIGTDSAETLVGTDAADQINGKGGNDTLKGRAANDTYHFDDFFGDDIVIERAFVKVGTQRLPGGTDTLNFSQFDESVFLAMIPQWGFNGVNTPTDRGSIDLGTSLVENVVGGSGNDLLEGGSAKNTYKGGPGGDTIIDYGGDDGSAVGDVALPDLPASDDIYKGFAADTGNDFVHDRGGTADRLDLRPLESSDVFFDATDRNGDGTNDSLRIIINATTSVTVQDHFAPTSVGQENRRMEKIVFSNGTITSSAELNSLVHEPSSSSEGSQPAR